jgi:1,4-dihydroxy-2-naphthoate octaprenyltransferase
MNFAMWRKALNVIPEVSKPEWDALDVISKWLISTRAAVLVMTFISAALAGLFSWRDGAYAWLDPCSRRQQHLQRLYRLRTRRG